jgi:hypothetical protein
MLGPSKALTISPPSPKDMEESRRLVDFVDTHTSPLVDRVDAVQALLLEAARALLHLAALPPPPPPSLSPPPSLGPGASSLPTRAPADQWVQVKLFGSTGLGSNVRFSDIDAYVG